MSTKIPRFIKIIFRCCWVMITSSRTWFSPAQTQHFLGIEMIEKIDLCSYHLRVCCECLLDGEFCSPAGSFSLSASLIYLFVLSVRDAIHTNTILNHSHSYCFNVTVSNKIIEITFGFSGPVDDFWPTLPTSWIIGFDFLHRSSR